MSQATDTLSTTRVSKPAGSAAAKRQPAADPTFIDPATITTRFYGMTLTGVCLQPEFMDEETVIFDREAPLENGCFANFGSATDTAVKKLLKSAIDREQELDAAYPKVGEDILVPCLFGGGYSLRIGRDFCEEGIADEFERQRNNLKAIERLAPDLAGQLALLLDAKEAENEALMQSVFAEEDARMEAFGLAAAKRDLEATNDAERDAVAALCAYRCRNLEEARVKAHYLATAPGLASDGLLEEDVMELLLSFADDEKAGGTS